MNTLKHKTKEINTYMDMHISATLTREYFYAGDVSSRQIRHVSKNRQMHTITAVLMCNPALSYKHCDGEQ